MEGQRRIKGAGSCQGKRDGSGKTGADLHGRHLLGCAGCFFFFPVSPYSVGNSGRGVVEGRDEGEGEVVLERTVLNGRPRAGANWGKNGVEDLGRETFSTPDGPKWTAQRAGGGGECMNEAFDTWEHSRRP